MSKKLVSWDKERKHDASLARMRTQMASVCSKLPPSDPARASCDNVFRPAKA